MLVIKLAIVFSLILLNAFFALSELALISSRSSRLQHLAQQQKRGAQSALALSRNPEEFLSTIQVGITVIGILAGAFGGAAISDDIARYLEPVDIIRDYREGIALILIVIPITYFSIVLGELVPKRFALSAPEEIACAVAPFIRRLAIVTKPLVSILSYSSRAILSLFGIREIKKSLLSEREIKLILKQGREEGALNDEEEKMMYRVLRLSDRDVRVLMTPRHEVVWINLNSKTESWLSSISEKGHSMYPLCDGTLDAVKGMISSKVLLERYIKGTMPEMTSALLPVASKPILMIETLPATKVLELLKRQNAHTALIIDEYGQVQGLISLYDILRAVFEDRLSAAKGQSMVQRDDGSLLVDGLIPLDEFIEWMGVDEEKLIADKRIKTLGGFVASCFPQLPKEGMTIEAGGYRFEIIDMDGRRIDKLLVPPLDPKSDSDL